MADEKTKQRLARVEQLTGGHESDGLRQDLYLVGEAVEIIRRCLADLVEAADAETTECADDLERLKTIAALLA